MTASSNTNPASGPASGDVVTMEKIVALSKRRGFVFPSSEIYGGVGSTYDFGHYGVLLKGDGKGAWWRGVLSGGGGSRGDRRGDPAASARLGGLGPPRRLHRPARGLSRLRSAFPRRSPGGAGVRAQTIKAPGRDRGVLLDRGARLQPDVRDDHRTGEGVRLDRLSAPGDGAGHLHQLQERAAVFPQEAALR